MGEPNLAHWDRIDPLRLCDAANLWVGEEPVVDLVVHPSATPIWIWLQQAVEANRLFPQNPQQVPTAPIWISRMNLRAFAEQYGERPAFLFPEDREKKVRVITGHDQG